MRVVLLDETAAVNSQYNAWYIGGIHNGPSLQWREKVVSRPSPSHLETCLSMTEEQYISGQEVTVPQGPSDGGSGVIGYAFHVV